MSEFFVDHLSFWLGKLDQDSYLISRGVRMLGSHVIEEKNYKKIKGEINKIVEENRVKLEVIIEDSFVDIIIYSPIEGKVWLDKLKKLNNKIKRDENSKKLEDIFKKMIRKNDLSEKEKNNLKKLSRENEEIDKRFGGIFGYSESSIRRSVDKEL